MGAWLTIAAVAVLAFVCWHLYRRMGAGGIAALTEKRRPTSRFVSRGAFVDGDRQVDVALALTRSAFFYENRDMRSSLELQWVTEIEYDAKLATGRTVEGGKVLRLRCYDTMFEFVVPNDDVTRWHMMLPPRRWIDYPVLARLALIPVVTA